MSTWDAQLNCFKSLDANGKLYAFHTAYGAKN